MQRTTKYMDKFLCSLPHNAWEGFYVAYNTMCGKVSFMSYNTMHGKVSFAGYNTMYRKVSFAA